MRLVDADELMTAFPCGERITTECVRATIDHAPTVSAEPRWIPVAERKPDDGYRVIVTDFGYVEAARWFDGRWYDIDGNTLKGVTAWMPLPEPWKGENDG